MSFKKKILIVGGTGFIGFHLAKKCLKKKFNVFSLSKSRPKKIRLLKKVKYIFGNIQNKNNLKVLNEYNFDYVVNCGGYVDHINKKVTYNTHVNGSKNLYNFFKDKKIKLFLHIGSSSEYGKKHSPISENVISKPSESYGKSKLMATNFLLKKNKENNFPVVIIRFFQLYGPYQDTNRFIPFIINKCILGANFDCSPCTQKRDFLYIDDAINSIMIFLGNRKYAGQIFNIGSGKPIILKKIIISVIKIIKKGSPKFGKLKLRPDEPKKLFPNLNKAKKYLRWRSTTSFKKGLYKTIKFYKFMKIKNEKNILEK